MKMFDLFILSKKVCRNREGADGLDFANIFASCSFFFSFFFFLLLLLAVFTALGPRLTNINHRMVCWYLTIGNETVLWRIRLTIHEITKRRSLKAWGTDGSIAYRIRVQFTIGDVPFYSNLTFMRARVCCKKKKKKK